jgi:hypothetical protein
VRGLAAGARSRASPLFFGGGRGRAAMEEDGAPGEEAAGDGGGAWSWGTCTRGQRQRVVERRLRPAAPRAANDPAANAAPAADDEEGSGGVETRRPMPPPPLVVFPDSGIPSDQEPWGRAPSMACSFRWRPPTTWEPAVTSTR